MIDHFDFVERQPHVPVNRNEELLHFWRRLMLDAIDVVEGGIVNRDDLPCNGIGRRRWAVGSVVMSDAVWSRQRCAWLRSLYVVAWSRVGRRWE